MFQRKLHQGVSSMKAKFLRDIGAVSFNCARAGAEFLGNVLAGFVFGN
jgi:hypothetical protein